MHINTTDPFATLTRDLPDDSSLSWLQPLTASVGDLYQLAGLRAVDPNHSGTHVTGAVVERYQALARVSSALAKALLLIQPRIAQAAGPAATLRPAHKLIQGLPRWQIRQARDLLAANLANGISTTEIAAACGLSRSYFICAFRRATGETPHLCLMRFRVEKAKELLESTLPIAEIALTCGFADQSHLTRVFTKQVGMSPGVWRRERGPQSTPARPFPPLALV
jgi:AraC family transcriptional regulator